MEINASSFITFRFKANSHDQRIKYLEERTVTHQGNNLYTTYAQHTTLFLEIKESNKLKYLKKFVEGKEKKNFKNVKKDQMKAKWKYIRGD